MVLTKTDYFDRNPKKVLDARGNSFTIQIWHK